MAMDVIEVRMKKDGDDHRSTLTSMAKVESGFRNQGRWEEAEKLFVEVMETSKTKLGADHLDTLTSMANLALTYRDQGRWEEAEKLVRASRITKLGYDPRDRVSNTAQRASTDGA